VACVVPLEDVESVVEDSYCDVSTQPESERSCWPLDVDCPQHIIPTSPTNATPPATLTTGPATVDSTAHWRTGTWGHVRTVLFNV